MKSDAPQPPQAPRCANLDERWTTSSVPAATVQWAMRGTASHGDPPAHDARRDSAGHMLQWQTKQPQTRLAETSAEVQPPQEQASIHLLRRTSRWMATASRCATASRRKEGPQQRSLRRDCDLLWSLWSEGVKMLQQRPMDWTHRLFNRARSSRSQTLTDNRTERLSDNRKRLSLQVLLRATPLRAHPLRSGDEGGPALEVES